MKTASLCSIEKFLRRIFETKPATLCLIESFCAAFFKKLPPIQRAERWSPSAEGETPKPSIAPERGIFKPQGGLKRGKPQVGFPLSY
jgi:hypothetical protein